MCVYLLYIGDKENILHSLRFEFIHCVCQTEMSIQREAHVMVCTTRICNIRGKMRELVKHNLSFIKPSNRD